MKAQATAHCWFVAVHRTKLRGLDILLKIWDHVREKYLIKLGQINLYFFQ